MKRYNVILMALSLAVMSFSVASIKAQVSVVPQPRVVRIHKGMINVPSSPKVYVDKKAKISNAYAEAQFKEAGISPVMVKSSSQADIAVVMGKGSGHKEGYSLVARADGKPAVLATADDRNGALYAIETIRQMLRPANGSFTANVCNITDWPEFGWRDFMLDESRHFHGTAMVKRLLNEMVRLKMNTFHWHLVDDPGWRIEIKGYPKLTSVGSLSDYSHLFPGAEKWKEIYPDRERSYYTQSEIKEIVKYAAERGIRIIPEIEVPAHSYAAIHSYPELGAKCDVPGSENKKHQFYEQIYDVASPAFTKFITTVLKQVTALFPSKIVHIGGDEAHYDIWANNKGILEYMKKNGLKNYADLQLFTINKIQKYLDKKGVSLIGWNEITGDNVHNEKDHEVSAGSMLHPGTLVQFWDGSTDLAKKAIKKGYKLVNSDHNYTYLDYPYESISLVKAYSFTPYFDDLTPEQNAQILGCGCQMWGERTPNSQRIYFQVFPRIGAYAECGWTSPSLKNYADFVSRIAPIEKIWQQKGYFTGQPSFSMDTPAAAK